MLTKQTLTRSRRFSWSVTTRVRPASGSFLVFPGLSVSVPRSCALWQEYISAPPKEGIRLVEVMDVWASLCTISQINDWLMVWEISKLHRQATHFSCSFPLSLRPSSYGTLKVCWQKYGSWLRKKERQAQKTETDSLDEYGALWFFWALQVSFVFFRYYLT